LDIDGAYLASNMLTFCAIDCWPVWVNRQPPWGIQGIQPPEHADLIGIGFAFSSVTATDGASDGAVGRGVRRLREGTSPP
jgi:hypothetical protein